MLLIMSVNDRVIPAKENVNKLHTEKLQKS